jgi:hypothetical protein
LQQYKKKCGFEIERREDKKERGGVREEEEEELWYIDWSEKKNSDQKTCPEKRGF